MEERGNDLLALGLQARLFKPWVGLVPPCQPPEPSAPSPMPACSSSLPVIPPPPPSSFLTAAPQLRLRGMGLGLKGLWAQQMTVPGEEPELAGKAVPWGQHPLVVPHPQQSPSLAVE